MAPVVTSSNGESSAVPRDVTAGRTRRVIGPVDTIWLNMDRPNNLMVIHCVLFLEGPVDWDRVRTLVRTRLVAAYPVFHQRPVSARMPWGLPHWEDDPLFDLERHLKHATLSAPGDDAALRCYLDALIPVPFDRAHPLWELHLINGHGTGSVILCRVHHALADGIALTRVLLSLTDESCDGDLNDADLNDADLNDADRNDRDLNDRDGPFATASPIDPGSRPESVARTILSVTSSVGSMVGAVASEGHIALSMLAQGAGGTVVTDTLGLAARTGKVVSDLLFSHNPRTQLGGPPGVSKHAVWSQPFSLPELKRVGRLAGGTLNDVLMSVVAGALGDYLEAHGGERADLITMVPINVRPLDRPLPRELGNQFALVFLRYPSSIGPPLERLAETKRRMDWIKSTPEAGITFGLITAIGRTTAELERLLVNFFASKAIGVTTNVPGPATTRYLAGATVSGVLGWVPGSGQQTLGVCIFTYADTVRFGFLADADQVPDPERLVEAVTGAVEQLTGLVRQPCSTA